MSVEKVLQSWKKKDFRPLYWLEGEEDYYIDQLVDYAEHHILPESEASFNLSVFYGKDAEWAAVINACRRYPMFAEKQVVLLKEAQQMKDIDKLEPYFENPSDTTIFIIAYKGKTYDKRTKLYKLISKQADVFLSAKLKDEAVHGWIVQHVKSKGLTISDQSATLLEEHIGNDLSRIANEVEKLTVNLGSKKMIEPEDIEKYIGISKEFNVFELSAAIAARNLPKALTIIQYFNSNPKAGPIQAALPAMYVSLSKAYQAFGLKDRSENALKSLFFYNPNAIRTGKDFMRNYGPAGVDQCLLLLHQYNLKGVGVGDNGTESASLLKEMVVKMIVE